MRPTKTQNSLRTRAVRLESSLSPLRNVASLAIQNVPSEDSDQTARPYLPYLPIYLKYSDRHAEANSVDP